MIFKFPQKKIVLDCFTHNENVLKTAPIVPAMKLIPDWWKQIPDQGIEPGTFYPHGTMKNCYGMIDYYKKSFAIPLWTDMAISINNDMGYTWQFSDRTTEAVAHNLLRQATGFLNNFGHIKIHSPWYIQEKQGIQIVWSQPTYSSPKEQELILPPAVIDFKHQNAVHLNMLFSLDKPRTIMVPQGQSMIHLTPITDKKVEIVRHLLTIEEYNRKRNSSTMLSFIKKHAKTIERKKQFSDCPFHNHTKGS
jgi:hypothetical protein